MKLNFIFSAILFCSLLSCSSEPKHEDGTDMTKVDTSKKLPAENPYKNAKLEVKVFNNDSIKPEQPKDANSKEIAPVIHGYGYEIHMFDALYIRQPHIPTINGLRGFHTREQAYKAGEFVCSKIRNNIMPPGISIPELDSLGVLK